MLVRRWKNGHCTSMNSLINGDIKLQKKEERNILFKEMVNCKNQWQLSMKLTKINEMGKPRKFRVGLDFEDLIGSLLRYVIFCARVLLISMIILVLWKWTFLGELSLEPLGISAVIVDHIVVSDPIHLTTLRITKFEVLRISPPVGGIFAGAFSNAVCIRAVASIRLVVLQACCKWCMTPVSFDPTTLGCPLVCIPQTGICLSLIHIWRCRRIERCRSRWSPYH